MDGPPPQEEDFSVLPVSERLTHKNWKARVSGYEALIKTFQTTASDTDPAFKPYINHPDLLKKIATDSNAVAQEKGLECLVALVKFSGETSAKTRDSVIPALVDKCFGSTRAGTKNHAVELALQYVEVENGGAGVAADILPGLGAKQPKTVAGCVFALKEIIRLFGTSTTPPAPILKSLPKIFSHSDKTVRGEGTLLTRALYQNLGPGIEPWLADLKPVQVKELKEGFEEMEKDGKGKGSLQAERLTRAQAREAEAGGGETEAETGAQEEPEAPPDPRTMAEPVDIVPKLPSSLRAGLTSSKWKERKEVLDELLALVNATPRIQDSSEFGELAKSLATCIQKDANINCVIVAAGCMEGLAKGVMTPFGRYRESVVGPMLERLKERKVNVTDAIGIALDAVFSTTTLPDIIPDILAVIVNKNPQVKEGSLKFFNRCLSTSTIPLPPAQLKSVTEPLSTLLEDGFAGARDEAATCLGTLMKMVGERPLNALLESLADVRKAKVVEAFEKATVKCKVGTGPAAAKVPPTKKVAPAKKVTAVLQDEPPKLAAAKPPPAKVAAKKPPAPAKKTAPPAAAATTSKPSKGGAAPASTALDAFKYKHTPEEAEELAADLIPSNIVADLGDANWKTRLAALEEMTEWVDGVVDGANAEVVIRVLAKKGWAEKNFQVSSKLYGILSILADRCPSFGRSCVAICVPHLSEKLGDMKLKKPAGDTLLLFSEKTSLQFVLNQAYEPLSKQKAPKVLADAIAWMDSAFVNFGIAGVSLRALIEFLKTALQNSNAAVRTSATKTLVTVKLFAGSSIKDFLEDLNPQLLNTITTEFDKVDGNPAPAPTRASADLANLAVASGSAPGNSKADLVDPLDELFPRVEIDALLKGTTILADSKSDAWKTKKEALEALQAILDQGANKRLKPQMGEIGQVLKARVTDTNKAVQSLGLDVVARIATGMGKPFEKHTRFFALPVATVLADQKAPVRATAIHTLTAIATACGGLDSMVHGLTTALESTNPTQRASLLNWLDDWFKEHEPAASLDLSGWASPVVSCLDDRNGDVRKAAQAILPTVINCAGFDYVLQQTNSLKPASRASAIPIIQAARATAQAQASVPATVAGPGKFTTKPTPISTPSPASLSPPPESPATPSAPVGKLGPPSKMGVRRKLPQGTTSRPESRAEEASASRLPGKSGLGGLKRPGAAASSPRALQSPVASNLPFFGANADAKKGRLGKDAQKWINEAGPTRKDLAELLQHQMEPQVSKDLVAHLFSHDHNAVNDHLSGLATMTDFYACVQTQDDKFGVPLEDMRAVALANFDLPLKYASIKAHEPQSNLIAKCLDVVDAVLGFLRSVNCQLTDPEALCFIPTMVFKLGDAREQVRVRIQNIIQSLPKVYAYSRVFQLLLEHGLKSKVSKTRQGTLDEMGGLLKRFGMGACEPNKAFPIVGSMIADKDSQVRKSALSVLSEGYSLVGEKVWSFVGPLPPKDKTQLEERLRRVAGPSGQEKHELSAPVSQITRLQSGIARPGSPATTTRIGVIPRPGSPVVSGPSKLTRPASPAVTLQSASPTSNATRPPSPGRNSRLPGPSGLPAPLSPSGIGRPKSMLPSRLGAPKARPNFSALSSNAASHNRSASSGPSSQYNHDHPSTTEPGDDDADTVADGSSAAGPDGITITISSILSSDPLRSVDALKKIQKILSLNPEEGLASPQYQELAEHTEGLIETITLQMAHVFERPDDLVAEENFRLAKHLIQTLNNFCDHAFLAESLTVDILTSLLEELTLRLLETDESSITKVKDLSRFINMIILRLFATGRRMSIFRSLFALLLQIVKPFPSSGTLPESQEARVAELVLKCVWKLARNIPQDLKDDKLDPVELFPAIEHFLQSVPPNEWRARATNKVPCGDMPLRTIKVIIQHVVAHYGDDVYDLLSGSFDDPSATIVYPYVYRILNSNARTAEQQQPVRRNGIRDQAHRSFSPSSSRPISPLETSSAASANHRRSSPSHRTSPSVSSANGNGMFSPTAEEFDPDAQLLTIIGHISSETTGALHKEGITELHQFLKAYPHKKPKVEKMLESTGAAFRKYINRALASRAAEDQERNVAVADTLSKLESNHSPATPVSPTTSDFSPRSPRQHRQSDQAGQDKLSRLHDIFQYRSSTISNGSSHGPTTPTSATARISQG